MKWLHVKENAAPKETILVLGKCGMPHVGIYDYGRHCHTECCYGNGSHFIGDNIEFDYWMPIPSTADLATQE